jgi:hypothetical protein
MFDWLVVPHSGIYNEFGSQRGEVRDFGAKT